MKRLSHLLSARHIIALLAMAVVLTVVDTAQARYASGDGLNLYQYVRSTPVRAVDPYGLESWTESSAREKLTEQITDWRGKGYKFAADLMQHFLDKKGPTDYVLTSVNKNEVYKHAKHKICQKITEHAIVAAHGAVEVGLKPGKSYPVSITHPGKGSEEGSNIRWWYVGSNKHMLYAYGGADLNVSGTGTPVLLKRGSNLQEFWIRVLSGTFGFSLGDKYEFDKSGSLKDTLSAAVSDAYDAAWYLETECGYRSFYHIYEGSITCP